MHEINLLPINRRKQLAQDLHLQSASKLLYATLAALGLLTVLAGVLCLSLWLAAGQPPSDVDLTTAVAAFQKLRNTITDQNTHLTFIEEATTNRVVWAPFIRELLAKVPVGVTFIASSGDVASRTLYLQGQAPARASVVEFQEALAKLPWVASIDAPLTNLLQRERPSFSFKVLIRGDISPEATPEPTGPTAAPGEIPLPTDRDIAATGPPRSLGSWLIIVSGLVLVVLIPLEIVRRKREKKKIL